MTPAEFFVLQFAPTAGVITTELLHVGPMYAVLEARRRGSLGTLDPVLFSLSTPQAVLWCIYGGLSGNPYYTLGSIGGVVLGIFYLMTVLRLVENPAQLHRMECFLLAQSATIALIVVASIFHRPFAVEASGVASLVSSAALYGAPFLNLREIFLRRDASSINRGFLAMQVVSGILWSAYSLFVFDIFVVINSLGSLGFGIVQIAVVLAFRKPRANEADDPEIPGAMLDPEAVCDQDAYIRLMDDAILPSRTEAVDVVVSSTNSTPTTSRSARTKVVPPVSRTISLGDLDGCTDETRRSALRAATAASSPFTSPPPQPIPVQLPGVAMRR